MVRDGLSQSVARLNHVQNRGTKSRNDHISYALGTSISQRLDIPPSQSRKIIQETLVLIDRFEKMMSFYDADSQVSQINNQAGQEWVSVNPELFWIIKEAKRYARLTDGLFNIMIAALVSLWQTYGKCGKVPPRSLIENALKKVIYEDILIDEQNSSIKLRQEGQKIDLGGIAKGYIANQVIRYYQQKGLRSAIINLGGNVALLGKREDGLCWKVGIQHPDQERGHCLATISASDTSVVTSGDYERFFLEGNRRYHHILHPLTGFPSDSKLRSVTIIYPDAMLSDVLSTTLIIIGLERGICLLRRFADIEAVIVREDKRIYLSGGLLERFQLIARDYSLFQF